MFEFLTFPRYHRQNVDGYCGAACVQMIFHGLWPPVDPPMPLDNPQGGFVLDQNGMFCFGHGQSDENKDVELVGGYAGGHCGEADGAWVGKEVEGHGRGVWISPTGLVDVLNHAATQFTFAGGKHPKHPAVTDFGFLAHGFNVDEHGVEDAQRALLGKAFRTICRYGVAPVVLVNEGLHWILVTGFETSVWPDEDCRLPSIDDIERICFLDPWVAGLPDDDHDSLADLPGASNADQRRKYNHVGCLCEEGGVWGAGELSFSPAGFISTYLYKPVPSTAATRDGRTVPVARWGNSFVLVADPEIPHKWPALQAPPDIGSRDTRTTVIDSDTAVIAAQEGLRRYLGRPETSRGDLREATPGAPQFVEWLGEKERDYLLVAHRRVTATVAVSMVGARTAAYIGTSFARKGALRDPVYVPQDVVQRLDGRVIDFGGGNGQVKLSSKELVVHPHLVWRPCRESMSPFCPFYMVTAGTRRLYVRVDGAVFTDLTGGLYM